MLVIMLLIVGFAFGGVGYAQPATKNPAIYGSSAGLRYEALNEGLTSQAAIEVGKKTGDVTLTYDELFMSPAGIGGYEMKAYTARGVADGTGGFDIDLNIPSGAVLVMAQLRVDVALVNGGANYGAAFTGGSTAAIVATQTTVAQNTKFTTFFDVNAATAILTDVTDIAVTPNTGNITAGVMTAHVLVYEAVDLPDTKAISYSGVTFSEASGNDGSVDTSVTLTLSGAEFAWANATNFVTQGYVAASNVPTGLTASIVRASDTTLTMTLTGNAVEHNNADDVSNLTVAFDDLAFAYGVDADEVAQASIATLAIDFAAPALTYSAATFDEAVANDGSIDNSTPITITLAGDTFTGSDSDDFVDGSKIVVSNLSTGLTAVATRTSSTVLSVTLTGNATAHADANDVADLTFTFADTAFTGSSASEVTNYAKSDLAIDFDDPE
jgi:hypothetical protein